MAKPSTLLDAVVRALKNSQYSEFNASNMNYLTYEPGQREGNIKLPLTIVRHLNEDRINIHNTDWVGYETDNSGNATKNIYHSDYSLSLQIDVVTASGSNDDRRDLANKLWNALYKYDDHGAGNQFVDSNNNKITSVTNFVLGDGSPSNDLSLTPNRYSWRYNARMESYHDFREDVEYIKTVDYPADGEFTDDDGDGTISDTSGE